jgi:hypothetical protein
VDDERDAVSDRATDEQAHPDDTNEVDRGERERRRLAENEREHEREDDDGGPVVEQALALDENGETLRGAQSLEERDDGDRVRRCDEGSEDERLDEREALDHRDEQANLFCQNLRNSRWKAASKSSPGRNTE